MFTNFQNGLVFFSSSTPHILLSTRGDIAKEKGQRVKCLLEQGDPVSGLCFVSANTGKISNRSKTFQIRRLSLHSSHSHNLTVILPLLAISLAQNCCSPLSRRQKNRRFSLQLAEFKTVKNFAITLSVTKMSDFFGCRFLKCVTVLT